MISRPDLPRERVAALSGVVFVVLLLVHAGLQGSPPTLEESGEEVVRHLGDKDAEYKAGAYLQGLAVVAFLWFLGSLWRLLRPAEGGPGRLSVVAVAATAVLVALVGAHVAILTGLALDVDEGLDPAVVSSLYAIAFVLLGMSAFGAAALTGAVGVLVLDTRVLPRWLGGLSLLSAGLWLLAGVGAATENQVWQTIGFIAFLVWLAWTAATSVLVSRRVETTKVSAT